MFIYQFTTTLYLDNIKIFHPLQCSNIMTSKVRNAWSYGRQKQLQRKKNIHIYTYKHASIYIHRYTHVHSSAHKYIHVHIRMKRTTTTTHTDPTHTTNKLTLPLYIQ